MDNLDTLFNKKEYDLVLKLTEMSQDPKELLMRISCLVILGKQTYKFILSNGRYIILYNVSNTDVFINKFLDARKNNKILNDLI